MWRTFYADWHDRFETRGVRATERPVSFIPKGALTHHPEGAVVLPAATVRSARRMRLLRKPYGQCHITAVLLSLSTQTAQCSASYAQQGNGDLPPPQPPACENLPPAVLSQLWVSLLRHPFPFCEKETKTENERTVRTGGDLSLGSKGGQQRYGALCGCRFRLSELF